MGDPVPEAVTQVTKHNVELLSGAQGSNDYQVFLFYISNFV